MTICFQRLRSLEDGWPEMTDTLMPCYLTTTHLLPTLDWQKKRGGWSHFSDSERCAGDLLRTVRGDESRFFFVDVCLVGVTSIHMHIVYTYIHIKKKTNPQVPHGSQQEIWGTPAWAARAVVSSAWWRQTFYWDRVESGVGIGVWYMLERLGLRQNGNETRLNLQKRWYHGIMAQSV